MVDTGDRGHGAVHDHVPIAGIVACLFGDTVGRRRRAAEDHEGAFVDGERTADAHTAVATVCFDRAAVDGDAAAVAALAAADARGAFAAGRGDRAAVDGDAAAGLAADAADARGARAAGRGELAGAPDGDAGQVARVDLETAAVADGNALFRIQRHAVKQDEVYRAGDLGAAVEGDGVAHDVPGLLAGFAPHAGIPGQGGVGGDDVGPCRGAVVDRWGLVVHGHVSGPLVVPGGVRPDVVGRAGFGFLAVAAVEEHAFAEGEGDLFH